MGHCRWRGSLILAAGALLSAQVPEEFTLPEGISQTQEREAKGPWKVDLGAMLLGAPKAPGSEAYRVLPLPVFKAEYDDRLVLGSSRIGVGAGAALHVVKSRAFVWDLGLGLGERRREKRADELAGMGDRDGSLFAGTAFRFKAGLFGMSLSWAQGLKSEVGGRGTISMGVHGHLGGRWLGSLAASGTWSDAKQMAWEFGVNAAQADARAQLLAAGDPRLKAGEARVYAPEAGWRDAALTGMLTYLQDRHWHWFGIAKLEKLGTQATDSPLVRKSTQGTLGLGFSYAF
jgi:outer membrane protein